MFRVLAPVALSVLVIIFSPFAHADTLTQRIATQLSRTPVYIDPSVDNADADTARLLTWIGGKDEIVVAILPQDETTDLSAFATELAGTLPAPRTVVVAAGSGIVVDAAANWPPQIAAGDFLRRSRNVSSNTIDTILKFIDQVHAWQERNPKPAPPPPPPPPFDATVPIAVGAVGVAVAAGGLVLWRRAQGRAEVYGAPRRYRRTLRNLRAYRDKVDKESVARDITIICRGAVDYLGSSRQDAAILHRHLRTAVEVSAEYCAIESKPDAYSNAAQLLAKGENSIHEFRRFVEALVQKKNTLTSSEFEVNTAILEDAKNSTIL